MYVYIKKEEGLCVGFYMPNGEFYIESQYTNPKEAASRVNYLNGGTGNLFVGYYEVSRSSKQ